MTGDVTGDGETGDGETPEEKERSISTSAGGKGGPSAALDPGCLGYLRVACLRERLRRWRASSLGRACATVPRSQGGEMQCYFVGMYMHVYGVGVRLPRPLVLGLGSSAYIAP